MYKYKRNGFTLVELMAVITIISLIALLTFPNIINQIKKTKKSNNKMIEDVVIEQAKKYVSDNEDEFQDEKYCFSIDTLVDKDYVKDSLFRKNDYLDKKVIYITNSNEDDYNYKIMDKDKCSIYDFVDNDGNGYTKMDYIKSTGTQYINTGVKCQQSTFRQKTSIEIDRLGTRQLTGANSGWWWGIDAKSYYEGAGTTSVQPTQGAYDSVEFIIDYNNNKRDLIINGQTFSQTYNNFSSGLNQDIYLFKINNSSETLSAKIEYFQIYKDDVLVRDYIPVFDKNFNICLFDKIEKKCYYNQGTKDFIGDKRYYNARLKSHKSIYDYVGKKYYVVQNLQSTGTQYINTGVKCQQGTFRQKTSIEIDRLGTRQLTGANFGWWWGIDANSYYEGAGTTSVQPTQGAYDSVEFIIDYNNNKRDLIINGQTFSQVYNGFNGGLNQDIYLFRINNYNASLSAKIEYYQIYEDDVLIRDYIPVFDAESIRPCLFDKVEKKCYYNQGESEFLWD